MFGLSSSKSSTTNNNDESQTANTLDGNSQGSILTNSNNMTLSANRGGVVQITSTDHGAVTGALGLASDSLMANLQGIDSALLFAGKSQDAATDLAGEALQRVSDMSASQLKTSTETVDKVSQLAESLATGGENRNRQFMLYAIGGVLVLAAIFGIAYLVKKS